MARGELLRKLFAGYAQHDDHAFRTAALEVIAEEQQKQNHALARDLLSMLENTSAIRPKKAPESIPQDKDRLTPLVDVRSPVHALSDIILADKTRGQLARVLEEYRQSELLQAHGLKPMRKLLFCGPPGCGKTLCSEIVAAELQVPLLYTRFDAIVSSFLGETSANLRKIFDYAGSNTWVVLFDEFDSIGKSRSDTAEHGELKRVVNSFLQLLDSYQGRSIIIAATNHQTTLDHALWRRFDDVILFDMPDLPAIRSLLRLKLRNFPQKDTNIENVAKKVKGLSYADIEWVCHDAIKSAILQNSNSLTQELLEISIGRQRERARIRARSPKVSLKA
jgi:SpoVK/Ycf46/Vps4 family AAA+-type ATPase